MFPSLVLAVAALFAQPSTPSSPTLDGRQEEVRRLVRRLDAAQLAQREAAEAALIALGPSILDGLPAPDALLSAEVQQRLGRIRLVLQRRLAESSAQPSLVTLSAESMPLSAVLAEIVRQTENAIHDSRRQPGGAAEDPRISVHFAKTPFWQALDTVLDQAGMDVYPYTQQRGLSLVARTNREYRRSGRAAYSGPFRIEPTSIDARRSLRAPASAALRLTLEVSWEPRIHPINIKQRLADLQAFDERGRPLVSGREQGELEASIHPLDTAKELELPLPLPSRDVRRIASLKGRLMALLPGREATFRFGDLAGAANVEKRIAGAAVVLEGVRRNGELWEVRILVRFDRAAGALESYRGWIFQNEAYLEGPEGKPIRSGLPETTRQTDAEVGLAYSFKVPGSLDGYQFVYRTPVSIVATGFDYELRGIELP